MKPSEKFKQAIREGKIQEAFAIAMGNTPQLHITSWIAEPETNDLEVESQPKSTNCLRTHVNLVEGEIVNEIGRSTIDDELYFTLQQFHLDRVASSHQTVSENLQSLQQMFRLLTLLQRQQRGENVPALGMWQITNALPSQSTESIEEIPDSFNSSFLPPDYLFAEEEEDPDDVSMLDDLLTLDELDIEPDIPQDKDIESNVEQSSESSLEPSVEPDFMINQPESSVQQDASEEDDWGDLLDEAGLDEAEKSSLKMFDLEQIDFDLTDDER